MTYICSTKYVIHILLPQLYPSHYYLYLINFDSVCLSASPITSRDAFILIYSQKKMPSTLTLSSIACLSMAMASTILTRSTYSLTIAPLMRLKVSSGCNSYNYFPHTIAFLIHHNLAIIYHFSYFIVKISIFLLTTKLWPKVVLQLHFIHL